MDYNEIYNKSNSNESFFKKHLFLIIIIIIFIAAVAGFIYLQQTVTVIDVGPELGAGSEKITAESEKESSSNKFIVKDIKNEELEPLTDNETESNQAELVAIINSGDIDKCAELQGEFAETCQKNILMGKAVAEGDSSYCEGIEDKNFKESCITLADKYKNRDTQTTQNMKTSTKEKIIAGKIYQDFTAAHEADKMTEGIFGELIKTIANAEQIGICLELPLKYRTECINRTRTILAINALDETICEDIYEDDWLNNCINGVLVRKAIEAGDSSVCESIKDSSGREQCLAKFF